MYSVYYIITIMSWFLIALSAPILWSVSNYIDKFLVSKYTKLWGGIGPLIIFSSLIGTLLLPFIPLWHPGVFNITAFHALIMIIGGIIYVLAFIPYMYSLKIVEASEVTAMFQIMPVFGYILGFVFLKENLSVAQILACILIIAGAILIDVNIKRLSINKKALALVSLSALLLALNGFLFKFVAINVNFWTTAFWQYIGFTIIALGLWLGIPVYRQEFIKAVKKNPYKIWGLNLFNEFINVIGTLLMAWATLMAPLALVWSVNGLQPLIAFVLGIILTIFFPKIIKENLNILNIDKKIIAIIVILIGAYLLNK